MEFKSTFICNNIDIDTRYSGSFPVLDFVRKELKLTGTKEGCREGDCGACTLLVGEFWGNELKYKSVNSCLLPTASLSGKHIVTIEGINQTILNPIQQVFVNEGATQCGFCTPGFIISFTAYLLNAKTFSFNDALDYLAGNLCRCTGHVSIINSVEKIIDWVSLSSSNGKMNLKKLVEWNFIPDYFLSIPDRLKALQNDNEKIFNYKNQHYVVSGGTDIYVQKQENIYLSDLKLLTVPAKKEMIFVNDGFCTIDAMTTVTDLIESHLMKEIIPGVEDYLFLFGSRQIRNKATIGGNIINASPIADLTSIFLALNADLYLKRNNKERKIPLKDFYLGYKQLDKYDDEILSHISFSIPDEKYLFNYEKVSRRKHLDIASVNTSLCIKTVGDEITVVHLSAGGVAPIPLYLGKAVKYLTNNKLNCETLLEAVKITDEEISPISDVRGSAEYKRLLLRQLIFCHFIKLFPGIIKPEELL